ncbi:FkbM family methyltransferase [Desulfocurvibacter africanus]|uniref:FkbM family methyltransferase n=1 Tax=Desulfocurvibacter africanus TaxID=873 RepID=UPI00048001DC|nr:FkbM family methyltransferase [Desulfocurvibacter africanus]
MGNSTTEGFRAINGDPEQLCKDFLEFYGNNLSKLLSVDNYAFHRHLFNLSVHGLGILNYQNEYISGERHFLQAVLGLSESPVVLDVGANVGKYSRLVKKCKPNAAVYAFEPHPESYATLSASAAEMDFEAFNLGMSDAEGALPIFDYADAHGSSHATLYKDVIEKNFGKPSASRQVRLTTLDSFLAEKRLECATLLKIDTEGHELQVLRGARESILAGRFGVVQIEFNEMNVYSSTFFKDIIDIFPGHYFFRLLPDGLAHLGDYRPLTHELFAFQNIAILPKGSPLLGKIKIAS